MTRYIAQRLLAGLLTAFIVSLILFAILRTTRGLEDYMVLDMGGWEPTEKELRMIREDFGVHGPLHMQYFRWMGGWITGDWGESFWSKELIWEDFTTKLLATLQLVAMTQAIAVLVGIPAGVLMALRRNSWFDSLGRATFKLWLSIPAIWLATLMIFVGFYLLGWDSTNQGNILLPSIGYIPPLEDPTGNLIMFIWPALVLGLPASVVVALMMRSSVLDVLRQDYVQVVSDSGAGRFAVVSLNTLRMTLAPAVVTLGLTFPAIVGGSLIMERIFVLDGVGSMLVEAFSQRDFATIESLALFFCVWAIAVNTLVDIVSGWLDPNTRSTRKSPREEWDHLANPVRLV